MLKRINYPALAVLSALFLAGCTPAGESTTTGNATSPSTTTASASASAGSTTAANTTSTMPVTTTPETTPATTTPSTTPATTPADTTTPATTTPAPSPNTAPMVDSDAGEFYPAGTIVMVDLDGDGMDEEIYYDETDLVINGKSYKELYEQVFMNSPNQEHFVVADIDTVDPSRQLGILTDGPSDDYETFFFNYSNGELFDIGSVPAWMEDPANAFDGEGYIYGPKRLSVIQTWYAPARWKLERGILDAPYDIYHVLSYEYQETVVLKEELPIYTNMDDPKPSDTMQPQNVEFLATDNKNWVQLKGEDDTVGWFKFYDWDYIVDLDKTAMEVFDNLSMAD